MAHVYECFFTLKHYGGWSLSEMYSLPIGLRTWWLKRTLEEYEKQNELQRQAMR
jgi:hypothetical protein